MTPALKNLNNFHFNGLLLTKVYNVWAKKLQWSYVWWHSRLILNLKENRLVLRKITWRILQIFTRAHSKIWKVRLLLSPFIQNRKCMSFKFTEELCVMKIKNNGSFWPKYIIFELKKVQRSYFWLHCRLMRNWRKTDFYFLKWHQEFGKFSPEHVWKSKIWDFYWILLSKVENVWA